MRLKFFQDCDVPPVQQGRVIGFQQRFQTVGLVLHVGDDCGQRIGHGRIRTVAQVAPLFAHVFRLVEVSVRREGDYPHAELVEVADSFMAVVIQPDEGAVRTNRTLEEHVHLVRVADVRYAVGVFRIDQRELHAFPAQSA